jgi:hypothetical protein
MADFNPQIPDFLYILRVDRTIVVVDGQSLKCPSVDRTFGKEIPWLSDAIRGPCLIGEVDPKYAICDFLGR